MTVTIDQAATLLAVAAAYDQRTIGRADATAWQAALEDLDFDDCRAGIVEHYREHRERITVADIRSEIRATQRRAFMAATRPCRLCDIDGWRYEAGTRVPMTPYQRCDHRPRRSVS